MVEIMFDGNWFRYLCIFSTLASSWVACFSSESGLPSTHRPGHRSCARSFPTGNCPRQRPWAVYTSTDNSCDGIGWFVGLARRSEFRLCSKCRRYSIAESSLVARLPHTLGEFAACFGIRANGPDSPDRGILCRCGACWDRVDDVGFRTLGGGAAQDANLGARPLERHGNHDLAGAMVLGGVIWGSAGAIAGTSSILLGAAVLFLASLFLVRRLSINLRETSKREVQPPSLFVSNQERRSQWHSRENCSQPE